MHQDVVDLAAFYHTPLGRMATRMIRRGARRIWPDLRGSRLLGLGFAPPLLESYLGEAERTVAAMPAGQGVTGWPERGDNHAGLIEADRLPFADMTFDRVILMHGLECTEDRTALLNEVWRVLDAGGRLLVVVPNRRGIWARIDRTPFGQGHPYSATQLSLLLKDTYFAPTSLVRALFLPPFRLRMLMRAAAAWEEAGSRWFPGFGGVIMIEATKQVYRMARPVERARRPLLVPVPSAAGVRVARGQNPREPAGPPA